MKVSQSTIRALGRIVTGDEGISPYRSGPKLVALFNEFGADDVYSAGFPSRGSYAEANLKLLNGTKELRDLMIAVLDPREFLGTDYSVDKVCDYLNQWLKLDGYKLAFDGGLIKILELQSVSVNVNNPFMGSDDDAHIFIIEQIKKSERKIQEGDYDGAITNARSLLEAVLIHSENQIDTGAPKYDGDLPKLYKRVRKLLKLEPSRPDISEPLKKILSGFISVIEGVAGISNRMADRHARSYKPAKHHASLAVNSVNTMVNFLFDTFKYQKDKTRKS